VRKKILICVFLIVGCSTIALAQNKPFWLRQIESDIEQDKLNLRIRDQNYRSEGESIFLYVVFLKIKDATAGMVQIDKYKNLENPKERFKFSVERFSLSSAKNIPKTELKNVGDEGYIWTYTNGAATIMFRKGEIFINVFAPSEKISGVASEELAKTLAQYVDKNLP